MEIIDRVDVDVYKLHEFRKWATDNGARTWIDAFIVGGYNSAQVHYRGEYEMRYSLSAREHTLFSLRWVE